MRLSRIRQPAKIGMNMTPMIDIVFLLIIFFMTVSQITQILDEPINLAKVGPDGKPLATATLTINLDNSGQFFVAGKNYPLPQLSRDIRTELKRLDNDTSRLKVLIRCDKDCPGKFINELTEELGKLKITLIRLSVEGANSE